MVSFTDYSKKDLFEDYLVESMRDHFTGGYSYHYEFDNGLHINIFKGFNSYYTEDVWSLVMIRPMNKIYDFTALDSYDCYEETPYMIETYGLEDDEVTYILTEAYNSKIISGRYAWK